MRSEDEAEQARQAKRRADAKLEARLRALGLLDPDDDLVAATGVEHCLGGRIP